MLGVIIVVSMQRWKYYKFYFEGFIELPKNYAELVEHSYQTPPKYTEIMAGVPEDFENIKTLEDLLAVNYKIVEVRESTKSFTHHRST